MKTNRPIILASSSPRRQHLMNEAGFTFDVKKPDVEEDFPDDMPVKTIAGFLAKKKAEFFRGQISQEIVITADTVVILGDSILNKPVHRDDAIRMLSMLSARTHLVITAVYILSREKEKLFEDYTEVTFKKLSHEEIEYYVDNYPPYDKAGAYGAQDWIGMVAVEKISGSYFNVMGLPIHKVYQELVNW